MGASLVDTTPATDGDAIGGVSPSEVVRPHTVTETASVMAELATAGRTSVVRGNGTKMDFANPPSALDSVVDVSALDRLVEFAPGDLVVRVEAGMRMDALQALLRRDRLRLAVDEVIPGSTVGGVVATGLAGPIRYGYGAVRDLLIGILVVRADGVIARAGGKVVKNVAGYDLCKLYTGSYGTLGVIVEATFRLHPVSESTAFLSATFSDMDSAGDALRDLVASTAIPAAIELDRPTNGGPITVTTLVEGSAAGVRARVGALARQLGARAADANTPPPWWGRLPAADLDGKPLSQAATIRLTTTIDGVAGLAADVDEAASECGLAVHVRGSAGGLLYVGLPADAPVAELLERCRAAASRRGGFGTLLRAAPSVRAMVDGWGPVPGLGLMRNVKNVFDPRHQLSRGRFVGGI